MSQTSQKVIVPDVLGEMWQLAYDALVQAGLVDVKYTDEKGNPISPVPGIGNVVEQDPEAGTAVDPSTTNSLSLSGY